MRPILVLLFTLGGHFVFAQSLEGTRVFTGTLASYIDARDDAFKNAEQQGEWQTEHYHTYNLDPQISYGKIGKRNVLVAHGITLGYGFVKLKVDTAVRDRLTSHVIAPIFIARKYIALANKLYYAPAVDIQVGYRKTKGTQEYGMMKVRMKEYYAVANLKPISLSYAVKRNLLFMFQFSALSLDYSQGKAYYGATTLYKKRDYKGVSFGFNHSFAFGFQKLLSFEKNAK
jgi:hypothetical protein